MTNFEKFFVKKASRGCWKSSNLKCKRTLFWFSLNTRN